MQYVLFLHFLLRKMASINRSITRLTNGFKSSAPCRSYFYHFKLPFRSSFCESSLRNCRALSVAFSLRIVILGDLRGDTWAQFFLGRWSSPWKEIERLYVETDSKKWTSPEIGHLKNPQFSPIIRKLGEKGQLMNKYNCLNISLVESKLWIFYYIMVYFWASPLFCISR